jgi:DNA-directed RNA polymerase specialized sigma24 family protein
MSESRYQLDELLADSQFARMMALMTKEVMHRWNVAHEAARCLVLSAIGEPKAIAHIYKAWTEARETGRGFGLAKVIVRRRVLDLLDRDARPAGHSSFQTVSDEIESDAKLDLADGAFDNLLQRNPQVEIEYRQIIHMVRAALSCFATQGEVQLRQAQLLQRYALDGMTYEELSRDLACAPGALRVRVNKAMKALRRHILGRHPELRDLVGVALVRGAKEPAWNG